MKYVFVLIAFIVISTPGFAKDGDSISPPSNEQNSESVDTLLRDLGLIDMLASNHVSDPIVCCKYSCTPPPCKYVHTFRSYCLGGQYAGSIAPEHKC